MSWVSDARDIQKRLKKLLKPDFEKGYTQREINDLLSETRTLYNALSKTLIGGFEDNINVDEYRKEFKKTASLLRKMGYKLPNEPKNTKVFRSVYKGFLKEYDQALASSAEIQEYFARSKLNLTDSTATTLSKNFSEVQDIRKHKGLSDRQKAGAINKVIEKVQSDFSTRFTILDLPDDSKSLKGKLIRNNSNTGSREVQNVIEKGLKDGRSRSKIIKNVTNVLDRRFPSGKVTTTNIKNGKATKWSQDSVNYAAGWIRNTGTRSESEAVIQAMSSVNADIVRWNLSGGNHTEICQRLASIGFFSLSGKSASHPKLPIAPPAHYGCKSFLTPAPFAEQESYVLSDKKKSELFQETNRKEQEKIVKRTAKKDVVFSEKRIFDDQYTKFKRLLDEKNANVNRGVLDKVANDIRSREDSYWTERKNRFNDLEYFSRVLINMYTDEVSGKKKGGFQAGNIKI